MWACVCTSACACAGVFARARTYACMRIVRVHACGWAHACQGACVSARARSYASCTCVCAFLRGCARAFVYVPSWGDTLVYVCVRARISACRICTSILKQRVWSHRNNARRQEGVNPVDHIYIYPFLPPPPLFFMVSSYLGIIRTLICKTISVELSICDSL